MFNWQSCRLGDILVLIKNGTTEPQNKESLGVPVTRIETISNGDIDYTRVGFVDSQKDLGGFLLDRGDILLSHINSLKHIGKVAFFNGERRLYHGMNLLRIKVDCTKASPKFVYYLLNSQKSKEYFQTRAKQAVNQASLNQKEINALPIDLPSLNEQFKIIDILTSVDNAISKTEAIIEQTEKVKKGVMQQLLTKGIGHTKFKQTEIGEVPEEWNVKTFEELLSDGTLDGIQDGNHGNSHPKSADYVATGIPFIMANNLKNGTVDTNNCNFLSREQADNLRIGFSFEGDVLLSHKGTIGKTAIVPKVESYVMLTPQVTYYRISNTQKLLREYLKYYFDSEGFQSRLRALSAQSTRSYIGITTQKQLSIALPPIKEQQRIVEVIRACETKVINERCRFSQLQAIKNGQMQVLLTGKVKVKVNEQEVVTT